MPCRRRCKAAAAFLDAQAEEHWNDVEELLGMKDVVSKSSYRRYLISRMQELRMVSFDLLTPNLYTCTTKMELPPGTVDRVRGGTIVLVCQRNS